VNKKSKQCCAGKSVTIHNKSTCDDVHVIVCANNVSEHDKFLLICWLAQYVIAVPNSKRNICIDNVVESECNGQGEVHVDICISNIALQKKQSFFQALQRYFDQKKYEVAWA